MLTDPLTQDGAAVVSGEGASHVACPRCGIAFTPKRRNQTYCFPPCQKAATRNLSRGSQKITDSPAARQTSERQRGRAFLLNDELYSKPPADRPAFMEIILRAAREHDSSLRRILSDRRALSDFGHDYAGRPNLARTLDDYCQRTQNGARVWQVIAADWTHPAVTIRPLVLYRNIWTEPDTGPERPLPCYAAQDPADFLARIRMLRRVAAQEHGPATSDPDRAAACREDQACDVGLDGNCNAPL